ncbi:MAG: mannose-6-phosphate isomerase, class I [Deltaproteobacteria bacterium]|nr:MAG: mannose-6-phosphate isomerase, class I [Deltaproteobacteria bacterium]
MRKIGLLKNCIQEYAWGSRTAIPGLLGQTVPADKPQAELWMGAHPKAPSQVLADGAWRSLPKVIQESPEETLGQEVAARFSNKLPFLFKVLAAAKPLSIQAHPNKEQAEQGFARENELGIPFDAPQRNYRDDNHKPEIICALTPFWALNGFRKIEVTLRLLEEARIPSLAEIVSFLRNHPNREGLKKFFNHLMTTDSGKQRKIVEQAVNSAEKRTHEEPVWTWMIKLNEEYPGDMGILSPLFLNLVRLEPLQAMYLPAGELHAYLEGVGIELMANSDNVLRGGLTPKHIDVQELLAVLNFTDGDLNILGPGNFTPGEAIYSTEAAEFVLSVMRINKASPFSSLRGRSVEMMICTEGEVSVTDLNDGDNTRLTRGISIIVPAAVEQYSIEGDGILYKAAVPV